MEKEQFLFLVRNFTSLKSEEVAELEGLQRQYPYCQIIPILIAKGAQNGQPESFQKKLHQSAVYSADRAVLKSILAVPLAERSASGLSVEDATDKNNASELITVDLEGDELIHEVMADLDRLKELKHNFEVSFQEYDRTLHTDDAGKTKRAQDTSPKVRNEAKAAIENVKAAPFVDEQEELGDNLIDQIKHKRKLQPEGPKQKEQIEIINQFIKKQPTIPKSTQPVVDNPDLAEKSISLTDNIVSETLVEILLRQGKKDKAIEVLKKLIWKFPQKKAIFAAQIDELRK